MQARTGFAKFGIGAVLVAVLSSAACAAAPLPPPTIAIQKECPEDSTVVEKPQEDPQGGTATRELTSDIVDTLGSIGVLCGQGLDSFHVQPAKRVLARGQAPRVEANGCVAQMPARNWTTRPLCFLYVPQTVARQTGLAPYELASAYWIIQKGDGQGRASSGRPKAFVWRSRTKAVTSGWRDVFYFNRRDDFKAVLVRAVPKAGANSRLSDFKLWCINAQGQLEFFGNLASVAARPDATGTVFTGFAEELLATADEWSAYRLATAP